MNNPFSYNASKIEYSDRYKQPKKAEFGKLSELITDELIELCKDKKYIVIYGYTKSGKVIVGRELAKALNRRLIISDDYIPEGWKVNMYVIRDIIRKNPDEMIIIEGVQSGRLLRKGVENGDFFADLVIHIEINDESTEFCYIRDGEGHKLKGGKVHHFNKNILDKIYYEWHEMQSRFYPDKMPEIILMNTSFK